MKVCTDACLFGAWSAKKIKQLVPGTVSVLDIGTGTGLLSLMAAQSTSAIIDAIEIDQDAAKQAAENFLLSPWKHRLRSIHTSINDFDKSKRYDFIISNPPFYENDLKSTDEVRNAAMHDSELTFQQLIESINQHLTNGGYATVMLPFQRTVSFEVLAKESGLYIVEKLSVRQSPEHSFFRNLLLLSRNKPTSEIKGELSIHDNNRNYTPQFINLLKDYYFNL